MPVTQPVVKPPRLAPGDVVGVVAPASPVYNRSDVRRGIRTLESWGYRVRVGQHAFSRHGYLAGEDAARAADLNAMFRDPEVRAVFVTRGGYGSGRLLPHLDYDALRADPKLLVGFSDITSLHLAIHRQTGLVTFYGPGVAGYNERDLTEYKREYLLRAIAGDAPVGEVRQAPDGPWLETVVPGQAHGRLTGGCLSLIVQTLGTPYEVETDGRLLFIEDVGEEPYRMDAMLTHLLLAGKLQRAAGIIIGECVDCVPRPHHPAFFSNLSLEDVVDELIRPLGIPTLMGLTIGHGKHIATLPIGVMASLDAGAGRLVIEETATR